jgi:co-chaperonin GroES (HSP10)
VIKYGMPEITWKRYEKKMKEGDVETQRKSTEAFLEEREIQTKNSRAAREWENSRKKEFESHKPEWHKDKADKKEAEVNKSWNNLFKAGTFTSNLKPAPGYVLLGIGNKETTTETGIIISEAVEDPNEGIVLEVGTKLIWDRTETECPCKVEDRILFKRGAGLNLNIKGRDCKLIYFPDILGIFL